MKMLKVVLLGVLMVSMAGCAALMNGNKPSLRSDRAIQTAYQHELIEPHYSYIVGDCLWALLFPIGLVVAGAGLVVDLGGNNHYVVTDYDGYKNWHQHYLNHVKEDL